MQTQGLFDITPEMVDLSIAQETQQRAATALPGNDLAGIVYAGRLAGNRAGNILGEALGQVDPRKQQAMKVQDALKEVQESGINMNEDPASFYTKMSEAFAKRGMMNQATQASMKALEIKENAENRKLKRDVLTTQLEKEKIDLAKAQAMYAREIAKASGKQGAEGFVLQLEKLFGNATVESKAEALRHFNENPEDTDGALAKLKDKDGKPVQYGPQSVEANGKVYVKTSPEDFAATPTPLRHPSLNGYVVAGSAQDRSSKTNVTVVNPGKEIKLGVDTINAGNQAVKPFNEDISLINNAIELLKNNSPAAEEQVKKILARMNNPGSLSNLDRIRSESTGDLITRIQDKITRGVFGVSSPETRKDWLMTLNVLKKAQKKGRDDAIKNYRNMVREHDRNPDDYWELSDKAFPEPKTTKKVLSSGRVIEIEE